MTPPTVPLGTHLASDAASPGSISGGEKPKGRGKIQMRKMAKDSNMLVTFSKRKSGLFKKANELSRLCGVHAAVVVFSPAGKVFSFGNPSVDVVVDGYLNPARPGGSSQNFMEVLSHGANMEDSDAQLAHLNSALEASKKRGEMLDERRKERLASCWWEQPVEELNHGQLEKLKGSLEDLNSNVSNMARLRLLPSASTSTSNLSLMPGFGHI